MLSRVTAKKVGYVFRDTVYRQYDNINDYISKPVCWIQCLLGFAGSVRLYCGPWLWPCVGNSSTTAMSPEHNNRVSELISSSVIANSFDVRLVREKNDLAAWQVYSITHNPII